MTAIEILAKDIQDNECIIVFSQISRKYLTGFFSSDGILTIQKNRVNLYLDSRYEEAGKIQKASGKIYGDVNIFSYSKYREVFDDKSIERMYFEDRRITVAELESLKRRFSRIEFLPLGDKIEKLRMVKTEKEAEFVRESQKIAESAFTEILNFVSCDKTESEVAAMIEFFMKKFGASDMSFSTICVSGKNSSMPHGTPSDMKLQNNSFITLDFGCIYNGYCSDMTRTIVLGKANEKMKEVYETVLKAQKNAFGVIRAGVLGSEVDFAARSVIEKAGYGNCFGHSTGHGVGLEVHESPAFSPSYKLQIPKGSILSVEPGIYIEGEFGVRIEDLVFVTENGYENLNSVSKELLEI